MLGSSAPRLSLVAVAAFLVTTLVGAGTAHARRGLTVDDMLAMQRVDSPAVSPDGKLVAFAVRDTDIEANRGRYDIWVASVDGTATRRLTRHPENDTSPAWTADGSAVLFLSTRSGTSQVWRIPIGGGEAEQVTRLPLDIGGFTPFPDGKRLVLAIDVWPTARSIKASAERDAAVESSKVKARIYDQLLFRHWDGWEDGKYSHLFVWTPPSLGGKADDARNITPRQQTDSPTHPFGGMEEVSVAPGGRSVAFVARVGGRTNAWVTNSDVFVVPAGGGKPVNMTAANPGYDLSPSFSPDGRSLALLSMPRAGYEADRTRLVVIDLATRKRRVLTERWDRSPQSITWSADGRTIFTSADNVGNHSLFAVDVASGKPTVLVDKGTNADPADLRRPGGVLPRHAAPAGRALQRRQDRARAAPDHAPQRRAGQGDRLGRVRAVLVPRRPRRHRVWLRDEAGQLRRQAQGAGRLPHPRRPPGQLRRQLPLPLERAGLRRARLRRGDDRLPRLDRLRPGLHRRDPRRLGRSAVRGSHARPRRGAGPVPLARRQAGGGGAAPPTAGT